PRRVPPRVRPPVRGRGRGGAARARPGPARRRAAAAGVAAGDPPDPAAPRRPAPHRPAHRHRGRVRRAAPRPLRRHARRAAPRAAGHGTVLLTATVAVFVEPLRALFDGMLAARLRVVDGRCTGHFEHPPLIGEARAAWLRAWARDEGIDLTESWAYGDHYSDRPVLEEVGNPVAVNPDARLYRHAKRRRWEIAAWDGDAGAVSALLDAALEEAR